MPQGTLILQVTGLGHSLGQLVEFRPRYLDLRQYNQGTNRYCENLRVFEYGQPATLQNVAHKLFEADVWR